MRLTLGIILLISIAISNVAYSQNRDKIGFSPLAIAHPRFNCKSFIDSLSTQKVINIAWLYNTFGRDYSCIDKLLSDPRINVFQTHLINEPGHRNKRLEKHEFLYKLSPRQYERKLIARDEALKLRFLRYIKPIQEKLADKKINCWISPGLESNLHSKAGKVLIEWTKEAFPYCTTVWNPLVVIPLKRELTGANILEGHGLNPNVDYPCTVNLDGTDVSFSKQRVSPSKLYHVKGKKNWIESGSHLQSWLSKFTERCEVAFLWIVEYNCIDPKKNPKSFIAPSKRVCSAGTSNRLIAKEITRLK